MAEGFPFGRWKGQVITAIPEPALRHYLAWDQLQAPTRALIEAELSRRAGPGAPTAPATARPPGRRPVESRPPAVVGVDLDDGIGLCALDLIAAGTEVLLAQDPSREPRILAAATRLREALTLITPAVRSTPPAAARDDDPVPF
jgi:hypothetical protein